MHGKTPIPTSAKPSYDIALRSAPAFVIGLASAYIDCMLRVRVKLSGYLLNGSNLINFVFCGFASIARR
jgi:hypothetical protein